MTYSMWEGEQSGITLKHGSEKPSMSGDEDAVLIKSFEAESWDEACQVQCDHYGWGTYVPFDFDAFRKSRSPEEETKILFGDPEAKNAPLGILCHPNSLSESKTTSQDAPGAIRGDLLDRLDLPFSFIPGVAFSGATCEVCHGCFT